MDQSYKIKIIETLWKIIYSNKEADIYETNLMRRLAGLLYIDSKIMGDIKEKIKKRKVVCAFQKGQDSLTEYKKINLSYINQVVATMY